MGVCTALAENDHAPVAGSKDAVGTTSKLAHDVRVIARSRAKRLFMVDYGRGRPGYMAPRKIAIPEAGIDTYLGASMRSEAAHRHSAVTAPAKVEAGDFQMLMNRSFMTRRSYHALAPRATLFLRTDAAGGMVRFPYKKAPPRSGRCAILMR